MSKKYEVKGKTSKISFTSRCAIEVKGTWYTVEASEERTFSEDEPDVNIDKEWRFLCDEINTVIDEQCADIVANFK